MSGEYPNAVIVCRGMPTRPPARLYADFRFLDRDITVGLADSVPAPA